MSVGWLLLLLLCPSSNQGAPEAEGDLEFLRWVLVDVSPSMRNDSMRARALLGGAVDTIEWYQGLQANRGGSMRRRGVATSAAEQYEYEEALQFAPADTFRHFGQDGVALNASLEPPPGGFGGKPTMTSIAPKWAEQVRQGLLRPALYGDMVTQDNVGAPLYGAANGCCDNRSNALFVAKHGAALGLPGNFSMGAHLLALRARGVSGFAVPQDPVAREMIRFHYVENLAAWRQTYAAIKADAAAAGRPEVAVYGNVHIVENAYSVVVSQFLDVVWTETPAYLPRVGNPPTWGGPASGFSALQYKLGRACGNFSRPHWGIVTLTGCGLAPAGFAPQTMTATVAAAEAAANGAVAAMLMGDSLDGDDPCFPPALAWAGFADAHRWLLGPDRGKLADVALLYSVPTHLFIEDAQLGPDGFNWLGEGIPLADAFSGLARVAEDHGVLYDVLIIDHPSVSSFGHLGARLVGGGGRFRLAVLPVVLALSDADAAALASWVRRGGTLVAVDWNRTAMFDQDYRLRPPCPTAGGSRSPALQSLLADPGRGAVRLLLQEVYRFAFRGYHDAADDAAIAAALAPPASAPGEPPILRADGLPPTVWRNAWVHGGGPMRSVALVNYDGNASANVLRPVREPFNLTLRCDDDDAGGGAGGGAGAPGLGCQDIAVASITVLGAGTTPLPLAVEATAAGRTLLRTTVPANTIHSALGVVVFAAAGEPGVRAAAAAARKALERLRVALRSAGLPVVCPAAAASAAAAVRPAGATLQQLERGAATAGLLRAGPAPFRGLEQRLDTAVANMSAALAAADAAARRGTVAAASAASPAVLLSLAAAPPPGTQWQPLRPTTQWNGSAGYGWVDGAARELVTSPDAGAGAVDPLHGSFVGGGVASTLRLDIPGEAAAAGVITVVTGTYDTARAAATTRLRIAGGCMPAGGTVLLPGELAVSSVYQHPSFRFECPRRGRGHSGHSGHSGSGASAGRSVLITFDSDAAGPFYGDGYGQGTHSYHFTLNAVIVSAGPAAATAQGARYLAAAEGLAATQLLRWMFVGPFADPHFTARNRTLGPEAGADADYNASFDDGAGGRLRWQPLPAAPGGAAPLPLGMPAAAAAAAANRTVAAVLSTHLWLPENATGATVQLTGSTSALAEMTLNGEPVGQDRLVTGLLLQEFSVAVTLRLGQWNTLRVKAMQLSWAAGWRMALSAHAPGSPAAPVAGLRVRP